MGTRSRCALPVPGRPLQAPPAPARSPGQPCGHLGCPSGLGPLRRHPRHARPPRRPARRRGTLPPPRCAPGRHRPAPAFPQLRHQPVRADNGCAQGAAAASRGLGVSSLVRPGRRRAAGRGGARPSPTPAPRLRSRLHPARARPALARERSPHGRAARSGRASRCGSLQPAAPSVARGARVRGLRVRRALMPANLRAGRVGPSQRVQPRPPPVRGLMHVIRAPPRPSRLRTRVRAPLSATKTGSSARVTSGQRGGGGAGMGRWPGATGARHSLATEPRESRHP